MPGFRRQRRIAPARIMAGHMGPSGIESFAVAARGIDGGGQRRRGARGDRLAHRRASKSAWRETAGAHHAQITLTHEGSAPGRLPALIAGRSRQRRRQRGWRKASGLCHGAGRLWRRHVAAGAALHRAASGSSLAQRMTSSTRAMRGAAWRPARLQPDQRALVRQPAMAGYAGHHLKARARHAQALERTAAPRVLDAELGCQPDARLVSVDGAMHQRLSGRLDCSDGRCCTTGARRLPVLRRRPGGRAGSRQRGWLVSVLDDCRARRMALRRLPARQAPAARVPVDRFRVTPTATVPTGADSLVRHLFHEGLAPSPLPVASFVAGHLPLTGLLPTGLHEGLAIVALLVASLLLHWSSCSVGARPGGVGGAGRGDERQGGQGRDGDQASSSHGLLLLRGFNSAAAD